MSMLWWYRMLLRMWWLCRWMMSFWMWRWFMWHITMRLRWMFAIVFDVIWNDFVCTVMTVFLLRVILLIMVLFIVALFMMTIICCWRTRRFSSSAVNLGFEPLNWYIQCLRRRSSSGWYTRCFWCDLQFKRDAVRESFGRLTRFQYHKQFTQVMSFKEKITKNWWKSIEKFWNFWKISWNLKKNKREK